MLRFVAARAIRAAATPGVYTPHCGVVGPPVFNIPTTSSFSPYHYPYNSSSSPCLHGSRSFSSSPQTPSSSSSSSSSSGGDRYSIEGRYSHALFAAASAKDCVDGVFADVVSLQQALESIPLFNSFTSTAAIPAKQKGEVVAAIADKFKLLPITKHFLHVLAENKRLNCLSDILSSYETLYRKQRGEAKCIIYSAQVKHFSLLLLFFVCLLIFCIRL